MSCADDRYADEQLLLWAQEPPGVEPAGSPPEHIPPHSRVGNRWLPVENLPDLATYQPAA